MIALMLAMYIAQATSATPYPLPSTLSPLELYRQAIKTMRSITAPRFLKYGVRIDTSHKGQKVRQHFDEFTNVEKTGDRTGKLYVSGDRRTFRSFVRIHPDLFLGHESEPVNSQALTLQSDAEENQPLKTIGSVTAQTQVYNVTNAGFEDLPRCKSALHLVVKPLFNPLRYNLRDVWINPPTSRICRAVAVWRDPIEFAVQIATVFTVTLDLDASGFVDHWATSGVARFLGMPYAMAQDWTYSNIEPSTQSTLETLGVSGQ